MTRQFEIMTVNGTIVCDSPTEANWFAQGHMMDNGTNVCVVIVTTDSKIECACLVKRDN